MKTQFGSIEVSKFLNVAPSTVWKWVKEGKLKAYSTLGGHFRFPREGLVNIIKEHNLPMPDELKSLEDFRVQKYRILIVDDSKLFAEGTKFIIEMIKNHAEVDFEIETAYNGFEAGFKIPLFLPDLIILDYQMPKMFGDELCRDIRKNKIFQNIKILGITAYQNKEKAFLEAGANKVIIKSSQDYEENFERIVCELLGIEYKVNV